MGWLRLESTLSTVESTLSTIESQPIATAEIKRTLSIVERVQIESTLSTIESTLCCALSIAPSIVERVLSILERVLSIALFLQ